MNTLRSLVYKLDQDWSEKFEICVTLSEKIKQLEIICIVFILLYENYSLNPERQALKDSFIRP